MKLFDADSQRRENNTVARLVSMLPFWSELCGGHVFRWFGVNVPMSLVGDKDFDSDIDIIAKLWNYPTSQEHFFRAWEVKVGMLYADGSTKSLKNGKIDKTVSQLRKYREFGVPTCSLLEVYLCETGLLGTDRLLSKEFVTSMFLKREALRAEQFGYDVAIVDHQGDGGPGTVLRFLPSNGPDRRHDVIHPILQPATCEVSDNFDRVTKLLDERFAESAGGKTHQPHLVYCKTCKQIRRLHLKATRDCGECEMPFEFWD